MRLIVFDVDGTLVDSQDIIVAAQRAAFAAHGIAAPTREQSLSIVGLSLVEAFTVLAGPEPAPVLAESYKGAFAAFRQAGEHEETLFPGIEALLLALAARNDVRLGVATGKTRRGLDHLIRRYGWQDLFMTIQTADDMPSKPHPAMLLQAIADAGIDAGDAIMVGDTTFDVLMAGAAECRALGVTWGNHPVQALIDAGAHSIATTSDELSAMLLADLRVEGVPEAPR